MSDTSTASIAVRAFAVVALALGAARAIRPQGISAGEQRALVVLTVVVVLLVGGVIAWATLGG